MGKNCNNGYIKVGNWSDLIYFIFANMCSLFVSLYWLHNFKK